jgi:CRP/FNR family transcriptional regulator, nitrogen oxide reductase regulator
MTTPQIASQFRTIERTLAASPAFSGADSALLAALGTQCLRERRVLGTVLFQQGAPADELCLITAGIVRLSRSTADAELCILGLFGPRECIGMLSLEAGATYTATAYAASDVVEFVRVPAAALNERSAREPALAAALLRATASYAEVLRAKIDVLSAGSVPRRLARLFLTLSDRFGDELEDGSWVIPVSLSRRDLSMMVGSCMESVIRVVSAWQKQGLLRTSPTGFELLTPLAFKEISGGVVLEAAHCA